MKLRKIVTIFSLSLFLAACANNTPASNDVSNSQAETPIVNESSPKSSNSSFETKQSDEAEQPSNDCSIIIGSVPFSINESKQNILAKLDKAGLNYRESKPANPEENRYDSYYHIDGWMQIYFLNDVCVRLRVIDAAPEGLDDLVQTARGIRPGSTYSQMLELYGDSFETHSYTSKIVYTIYRYSANDCICEFGIEGEDSDSIYNIDIYIPSQSPIYKYGVEIQEAN